MDFDALSYPYEAKRTVVYGKRGMVATSQPLAAQAGLEILKKGGNAIDAAIATAAALTVVEPTSNGIGGDAFAIVWTKGKLHGLNASGAAPKSISIAGLKERGHKEIPRFGFMPVTVPGAPGAWAELSRAFGRLPLIEVLEPAITYAIEGYPVSPTTGKYWAKAYETYKKNLQGEEFEEWFKTFSPKGRPPKIGEIWSSKGHGETLRKIGETYAEDFYRGEIAEKIDAYSKKHGGFISKEDLAAFKVDWVEPVSVSYKGYDVWELPPNGQGIIALMALNILKGLSFEEREAATTYHKQIEAIKLAFADGHRYITDHQKMTVEVEALLSESYGEGRRALISHKAELPMSGTPPRGGTVYLAAADGEGNMVSFIQSNYMGFGSGLVVPGTGISLQNRGHNFSFDINHDNRLEGGKKPYHTIIPGFLTKDNKPVGPFGVMGGFMQPQGHLQVIMNTIDFKMNPQAALDAPRWHWSKERTVEVEEGISTEIVEALRDRGHDIIVQRENGVFGRGQIIWRNEAGVLCGGTESRTDGTIAAW